MRQSFLRDQKLQRDLIASDARSELKRSFLIGDFKRLHQLFLEVTAQYHGSLEHELPLSGFIVDRYIQPAIALNRYFLILFCSLILLELSFAPIHWSLIPAILIGLLIIEFTYRVKLYFLLGQEGDLDVYPYKFPKFPWHIVNNRIPTITHGVRGYDWIPEQPFISAILHNDQYLACFSKRADKNGNLGSPDDSWTSTGTNILVVGDSYTAYDGGTDRDPSGTEGVEWPYYLKNALEKNGISDIRIQNWARTGHGVLQMLDTATSVIEASSDHKIDLIICAFIDKDIRRRRFTIKHEDIGGFPHTYKSDDLSIDGATAGNAPEYRVIHPSLSLKAAISSMYLGQSDENSKTINHRYSIMVNQQATHPFTASLTTIKSSLLFCRIIYGNPFYGVRSRPRRTMSLLQKDYNVKRDQKLRASLQALRRNGSRVLFVRLPYDETEGAKSATSKQNTRIMNFITTALNTKILPVQDDIMSFIESNGKYCRSHYDSHPSLLAKIILGRYISSAYMNILKGKPKP